VVWSEPASKVYFLGVLGARHHQEGTALARAHGLDAGKVQGQKDNQGKDFPLALDRGQAQGGGPFLRGQAQGGGPFRRRRSRIWGQTLIFPRQGKVLPSAPLHGKVPPRTQRKSAPLWI
jgi:hypothetical protein